MRRRSLGSTAVLTATKRDAGFLARLLGRRRVSRHRGRYARDLAVTLRKAPFPYYVAADSMGLRPGGSGRHGSPTNPTGVSFHLRGDGDSQLGVETSTQLFMADAPAWQFVHQLIFERPPPPLPATFTIEPFQNELMVDGVPVLFTGARLDQSWGAQAQVGEVLVKVTARGIRPEDVQLVRVTSPDEFARTWTVD